MGGGIGVGGISGWSTDPLFVKSFKWADVCAIDCLGQWVSMKNYSSDTFNKFCCNNFILIVLSSDIKI